MSELLLYGITARRVPTSRLTVNTLELTNRPTGTPVLFVHGNVSSSLFWQLTMLDLPHPYRPIAMDLRGFGDTDPAPVDGTRGPRDFSDDVAALVDALDLSRFHIVGWSLGGGVVWQYLLDHADQVASATLIGPTSPYGFGGTRDVDGTLCSPPGAGSGGGTVNSDFVKRLGDGDTSADAPTSPRCVLRSQYVKKPLNQYMEDIYVKSMLSTTIGDDNYPGTGVAIDQWPNVAAGDRGVVNTMAPTYMRLDDLRSIDPKPPILWVRGACDVIVSDTSLDDLAYQSYIGNIPDWPGMSTWPPQPMVSQTRTVLDQYRTAGGSYTELALLDAGHAAFLDQPKLFRAALVDHLDSSR